MPEPQAVRLHLVWAAGQCVHVWGAACGQPRICQDLRGGGAGHLARHQ